MKKLKRDRDFGIPQEIPTRRSPSESSCVPKFPKTTILIVGEGKETEPNYFEYIKRVDQVICRFAITVKKGKGGMPKDIVQNAINRQNDDDYDQTYCILDVEGQGRFALLPDAIKLAQKKQEETNYAGPFKSIF